MTQTQKRGVNKPTNCPSPYEYRMKAIKITDYDRFKFVVSLYMQSICILCSALCVIRLLITIIMIDYSFVGFVVAFGSFIFIFSVKITIQNKYVLTLFD